MVVGVLLLRPRFEVQWQRVGKHQAWGYLDGASDWRLEGLEDKPGTTPAPVRQCSSRRRRLLSAGQQ